MRLPRRAIPVEVKCRVVLRQLGELWINEALEPHAGKLGAFLAQMLGQLAFLIGCAVEELRLDHDPALAVRRRVLDAAGEHLRYVPDEHDPEHLIYRSAHDHHIKTNVRGDGAQHPDRVLIKRERRRVKKSAAKYNRKNNRFAFSTDKSRLKMKSRPLRSANCWPPKGSRKIPTRRKP